MTGRLAAALVLTTGACSLATSLDGYTGGAPAAPDASTPSAADAAIEAATDAGSDADADADAAVDGGLPNLHPNGTFEATTAPWYGFQAQPTTLDPTARTGAKSLRVCTAPATTDYFTADDQGAIPSPPVGATYHVVAWVRATPDKPPPLDVRLFVRTIDSSPTFVTHESSQSAAKPIDANWLMFEATLTVTLPAQSLNVFVGASWAANACYLLDDVRVERLP